MRRRGSASGSSCSAQGTVIVTLGRRLVTSPNQLTRRREQTLICTTSVVVGTEALRLDFYRVVSTLQDLDRNGASAPSAERLILRTTLALRFPTIRYGFSTTTSNSAKVVLLIKIRKPKSLSRLC